MQGSLCHRCAMRPPIFTVKGVVFLVASLHLITPQIWVFPKIMVPGYSKMDGLFHGKTLILMDDLGG